MELEKLIASSLKTFLADPETNSLELGNPYAVCMAMLGGMGIVCMSNNSSCCLHADACKSVGLGTPYVACMAMLVVIGIACMSISVC